MASASVASAREFIARAELPPSRHARAAPASVLDLAFDTAKNQAAVVGSDIVSFVQGVTKERREAIVHSSLLAQQVATKKVADPNQLFLWYDEYFSVLTNIGWVVQEKNFQQFHESSENFQAHKAILAVATTLLGAAPAALALVKTTLESLQSMDKDSPWITIFDRESQHAKTARFQISLAEQAADGQFFVTLMAFALEAESTITQVLFFKTKTNEATLRHSSGKVTIDTVVLDGVSGAIKQKLAGSAQDYIKTLPNF